MKITKKLIVLCLVLVMGIAAVLPSTFSWYDHNDNLKGDQTQYVRTNLPVSVGTLSMETKKYRMDGNKLFYDEKGNKQYYDGNAITSETVDSGKTQFFGTKITNTGNAPAYVNLYLNGFTNDPQNYVGTIAPNLTRKGISSSVHLANKNMIRVYFQVENANNWKETTTSKYLVYTKKQGGTTLYTKSITSTITLENDTDNILSNTKTYYVDLDKDTTSFYFAARTSDGQGFNTSTKKESMPWYRTKTITDIQAEKGYYLTGVADDTFFYAQYATFDISGGVSVKTYFNQATMAVGQKINVSLINGTHYSGKKVTYAVSGSGLSVDANIGIVTRTGALNNAKVTATIRGSLGDTTTVDTTVTNPGTIENAVSQNIEVPAKKTETIEGETVEKNGVVEVVWFIENKSSNDCSFSKVYYTK